MGLFNRYKVGHILVEVVHPIYNWFSGAHLVVVGFFVCQKMQFCPQRRGRGGANSETHHICLLCLFFGSRFFKVESSNTFLFSLEPTFFFLVPLEHFQVIGLICHESGGVDIFMKEFYEFPNGHMEPENAAILREAGSCHRHEIFNL